MPPAGHLPRRPRTLAEPEVRHQARSSAPTAKPGAAPERVARRRARCRWSRCTFGIGGNATRPATARAARAATSATICDGRPRALIPGEPTDQDAARAQEARRAASSSPSPLEGGRVPVRGAGPCSGGDRSLPGCVEHPRDLGREVPASREQLAGARVGDHAARRRAGSPGRRRPRRTRRRGSRRRPRCPPRRARSIQLRQVASLRARSMPRVGSSSADAGRAGRPARSPPGDDDRQRQALALASGEIARIGVDHALQPDDRGSASSPLVAAAARRRPAPGRAESPGLCGRSATPRVSRSARARGVTSPAAARSNVLFPAPFRPISATRSPRPTCRSTPAEHLTRSVARPRARPRGPAASGRAEGGSHPLRARRRDVAGVSGAPPKKSAVGGSDPRRVRAHVASVRRASRTPRGRGETAREVEQPGAGCHQSAGRAACAHARKSRGWAVEGDAAAIHRRRRDRPRRGSARGGARRAGPSPPTPRSAGAAARSAHRRRPGRAARSARRAGPAAAA